MTSVRDSGFTAHVEWMGCVGNRGSSLRSEERSIASFDFAGMGGESHSGLTRPACGRVEEMYEIGIPIRNTRQVTVLSSEELEAIAQEMGVGDLPPGLLGANVVITGIPAFTLVPPGSRLQFNRGVTLTVDFENLPCNLPAREIEAEMPGFGKKFKAAAANRRGVTAWVERVGTVELGESARLFVPVQPHWPHDTRPVPFQDRRDLPFIK